MEYADRDIMELDKAGGYYCRHVSAMTCEGLHSKGDIAAELAHRDMTIDRLRTAIGTVCEGWTLPSGARKVLETALWAETVRKC